MGDVRTWRSSSGPEERPMPDDRADAGSGPAEGMGPATDHDEAALPMPDVADDLEAEGSRIANWWLKARRLREEVFGPELFAAPAWDILLDLYTAEARGECVQTSSLAFRSEEHTSELPSLMRNSYAGLCL